MQRCSVEPVGVGAVRPGRGLVFGGFVGWMLGDYPLFDALLRTEAALFLRLALAFVWLRPAAHAGIA